MHISQSDSNVYSVKRSRALLTFHISCPALKMERPQFAQRHRRKDIKRMCNCSLNRPPPLCKRLEGEHHPPALTPGSQDGNSTSPPLGGGGGGLQGGQGIQGGRRNSALGTLEGIQMNASLVRHPFASLQANWIVSSFFIFESLAATH